MRFYYFCPRWSPQEAPPPVEDQFDANGRPTPWVPAYCEYWIDGDQEFDRTTAFGWEQTPAAIASRLRCRTHNCRPRVYIRSWTAERHHEAALATNYTRHYINVRDVAWLAARYTASGAWVPYSATYITRNRPTPITSHLIWAAPLAPPT